MDNSLIPRAFSPTDAKREREANAREAERRSSARNASSSTIGAGGKLTLAGGIDVVDSGEVKVVGGGTTYEGIKYEVTATLTTTEMELNQGPAAIPILMFTSEFFGANAGAKLYSLDGRSLTMSGRAEGVGVSSADVWEYGGSISYGDLSAAYGNSTGKYREASVNVGQSGFSIKFRDDLAPATSAIIGDRYGNIDIQTSGALTQNGAPISGGGGGASSWDELTGKPTEFPPEAHTHAISDVTGLQTALDGKQTNSDSGWISAAYGSPWADYGGGFGGFQYRRLNGVLYIRGTIKGGTAGTTITTLPTGFRPIPPAGSTAMEFPALVYQDPNFVPVTCYAYADGRINYAGGVSNWTGYNRLIILDNFPL